MEKDNEKGYRIRSSGKQTGLDQGRVGNAPAKGFEAPKTGKTPKKHLVYKGTSGK
jgi:hypothetical protein